MNVITKCQNCGQIYPGDAACPYCNYLPTFRSIPVKEWLSNPALGLVREVRQAQVDIGMAIEDSLRQLTHTEVLIEGGCGVGKTYAYLVPSLLDPHVGRIVISTAKKQLQDQIFYKDLPKLQETLGTKKRCALLKGKGNYLCPRLFRNAEYLFRKQGQQELYLQINEWYRRPDNENADLEEGNFSPTEYPLNRCTATECSGCGEAADCKYRTHRSFCREFADVLVINHALLGYDWRFDNKVLNNYDLLIVDEAHTVVDALRNAYSETISSNWLETFARRLASESIRIERDGEAGLPTAEEPQVFDDWANLFTNLQKREAHSGRSFGFSTTSRVFKSEEMPQEDFQAAHGALARVIVALREGIKRTWDSPENFERYPLKWTEWKEKMATDMCREAAELSLSSAPADWYEFAHQCKFADDAYEKLMTLRAINNPPPHYYSVLEIDDKGVTLKRYPANVSSLIKESKNKIKTIVLTSATVEDKYLINELGLTPYQCLHYPSPFDYKNNCKLYVPKHLPEPKDSGYLDCVAQEIVQLIKAARGNGLILFTSYKDMEYVYNYVAEYDLPYLMIAQKITGLSAKQAYNSYLVHDNAVLFGTKGFFEGIDIPGDKLRLVVMVKLPFVRPDEPLAKVKEQLLGGLYFPKFQNPLMFMDVQQGLGRLIRTANDRGVAAILDSRVWSKSYGTELRKKLSYHDIVTDIDLVQKFYAQN